MENQVEHSYIFHCKQCHKRIQLEGPMARLIDLEMTSAEQAHDWKRVNELSTCKACKDKNGPSEERRKEDRLTLARYTGSAMNEKTY